MIVGFGFDRMGSGASGDGYLGLPYPKNAPANLTPSIWYGMSRNQQQLYLTDLNRSSAQQNYSTDSDYAKVYAAKEYVDNTLIEPVVNTGKDLISTAQQTAFKGLELAVLGIGIVYLLGSK